MPHTAPNSSPSAPAPQRRPRRSRAARAALLGGLAAGSAFAGFEGISLATTTSHTRTTASSHASRATGAPRGPRALGGPDGPMGFRGPGGPGGPGGGNTGTITAISGSTLTLRTENGTETVDTTSSTTYRKELQTISFSDLQSGDMVAVDPVPPSSASSTSSSSGTTSSSSSSSASTPSQPGTGTVTAGRVTVVEPSLSGRVTSISNGTFSLVGPGGQELTIATTGSTHYYSSSMSETTASGIAVGDHVTAEGTQSDLTHLTADLIAVMPTPPAPPAGMWGPGHP